MNELIILNIIQRGIILFWGLWFSVVTITDVVNVLQGNNYLPKSFILSSKNYDLVINLFSTYGLHSPRIILFLFSIIILWAFTIAISFWVAFFWFTLERAYLAFLLSLSMTAFFILFDEVFIQYELEHGHIIRIALQLISLWVFFSISKMK